MKNIEFYIKVILAIFLLICLLNMPLGYYQFIRLGGTIALLFLSYNSKSQSAIKIIWIIFAILLNPIFKIHFPKFIWNILDVILAIILIFSVFIPKSNNFKTGSAKYE